MLAGKGLQTASLLLTEEDFNVKFTVFKNPYTGSRIIKNSSFEGSWKEAFRDSLGEVTGSNHFFTVECIVVKNGVLHSYNDACQSRDIISKFWSHIVESDGAKLIMKPRSGSPIIHVIIKA